MPKVREISLKEKAYVKKDMKGITIYKENNYMITIDE
jgi:hypothetical protein